MPHLIVNADDFGLTPGVNRAIEGLHRQGVLTSATLMANGRAFDDAVTISQRCPDLSIGCHIVLIDGNGILSPSQIPTLCPDLNHGATAGSFRTSLPSFYLAALSHSIKEEEIEAEAIAQIKKLQSNGIKVSHVDTHKHTHLMPPVARAIGRAAHHCGVSAMRNPFEPSWSSRLAQRSSARRAEVAILRSFQPAFLRIPELQTKSIVTSSGSLGVAATGTLNALTLANLLAAIPHNGTWELVCHPGYNDDDLGRVKTRLHEMREIEMHALLSEIPKALQNGVKLTTYRDLANSDLSNLAGI